MTDREYLLAIWRCFEHAPAASPEEELLDHVFDLACERLGLDPGDVLRSMMTGEA